MNTLIKEIFEEMKELKEVEVIAIGGSRAKGNFDERSDYDIYVYYNKPIDVEVRKKILNNYVKYMEYSNKFWEEEDDGVLNDGVEIEFIYRHVKFLEEIHENIYVKNNTSFGYSTCHIDNIVTCNVVFDRNNIMEKYKKIYEKYPEELRENIIFKNMELLHDKMPSLSFQVIKALKRKDIIGINNRLSEYFAMYFDVIFALNYKYNTGEKRLLDDLKKCEIKPNNAVENIENLFKFAMSDSEKAIELITKMSEDLNELVKRNVEFLSYLGMIK